MRVLMSVLSLLWFSTVAQGHEAFLKFAGRTDPPVGYAPFCKDFQEDCIRWGEKSPRLLLTQKRRQQLEETNHFVNHRILPATDLDYYDQGEKWTIPISHGDCEDYVLLKRRWLLAQDWPSGALLIAVVFDEVGDGHAVLLARTEEGDFVLDNKTDEIRRWFDTPYRFIKRQDDEDPNKWVGLQDTRSEVATLGKAK